MPAPDPRSQRGAWTRHQRLGATAPPRALAPWVDRVWTVTWSYDEPYGQHIPPHLDVHLTFPSDAPPALTGPATQARHRVLAGEGQVVGVAFHPGIARAVIGAPVADLVDGAAPAAELLGPDLPDAPDEAAVLALLEARLPAAPDPVAIWCAGVVARIRSEPDLRRVDDVATAAGLGVRHLQRRFAEHVGLTPKQVIRQARLAEVRSRLEGGGAVDWAALAAQLGYADQAHLSRDLRALLGEPPTAYARRY